MQNLKRDPRGRRPKGTHTRSTAVTAALWEAFQELGGVPALAKWGREHPTEFYELCGQLLTEPESSTPPLAVH
jgi:hypothetical protein